MENHVQTANMITFTAAAPVKSGDAVTMGALFGVAATDAPIGAQFSAAVSGAFRLPKADDNIAAGARVFWDASESEVTTTAEGNRPIGAAIEAAGPSASSVVVRLDGIAV